MVVVEGGLRQLQQRRYSIGAFNRREEKAALLKDILEVLTLGRLDPLSLRIFRHSLPSTSRKLLSTRRYS